MNCGNCGCQIKGDEKFCPACGAQVVIQTPVVETPVAQTPAQPEVIMEDAVTPPQKGKNTGKLIAIIGAGVVVVAAVVAVIVMVLGSKGYEKRVENYLDFYATKETDVEKFFAYANMDMLGTDKEFEVYKIAVDTILDEEGSGSSYYGESFAYDDFEEYYEDHIDRLYEDMEDAFGDWELTYEIKSSKELSKKEIKELQKRWENHIEGLEDEMEGYDFDKDDEEIIEEYFDDLSDVKIEEAYSVKVKIKIDGDDNSLKETYEFTVANVDGNWVIAEGPSIYSFVFN